KGNNIEKATRAFERAYKEDKENAEYMSYYGMCAALRWGEIGLGLELCTRAVKKEFYKTEYYINLAKVYIKADNKKGAMTVLKKGLRFDPENDIIHEELVRLGARKKSIIPFLGRSNPINKFLGIFFRKTIPSFIDRIRRRKKAVKEREEDLEI
ncbi:MAG: hypothetical protein HY265_00415, partial [Deltaproteobacteria bacterium]|nr:hypothetical protein [Deltaproteobacteria bacterium]